MEVFSDIQSGKEIEWKIGNRKELRKKYARHDMPNESYLQNVHGKTTI